MVFGLDSPSSSFSRLRRPGECSSTALVDTIYLDAKVAEQDPGQDGGENEQHRVKREEHGRVDVAVRARPLCLPVCASVILHDTVHVQLYYSCLNNVIPQLTLCIHCFLLQNTVHVYSRA